MYSVPKSKSPPKFSLFGPCVDQSQCWSYLRGNPSCSNFPLRPSFPRVNRNCFQGAPTKSEEEMMCEMRWVKKSSNIDSIYINHWGVWHICWRCKTLRTSCTYFESIKNKFKINFLLIRSRWSLDRSCTSSKEEPNKNIGVFIWASQHGVWT